MLIAAIVVSSVFILLELDFNADFLKVVLQDFNCLSNVGNTGGIHYAEGQTIGIACFCELLLCKLNIGAIVVIGIAFLGAEVPCKGGGDDAVALLSIAVICNLNDSIAVDCKGDSLTNFLDVDDLLVFADFALFLGLFKAILTIVHELANRRLCLRCDLNQIELMLICQIQRLPDGHNTQLFAILIYDAHFTVADLLVNHEIVNVDAPPVESSGN